MKNYADKYVNKKRKNAEYIKCKIKQAGIGGMEEICQY